jgi:hemoglobin-like flavoprotein
MTSGQILLIKKSWKVLSKIRPELLGDVFYSKLFLEAPELKTYFKSAREDQSRKLIDMLNMIITSLDRLEELKSDIAGLAERHRRYGALPVHYERVGAALLWTIDNALGRDYTPEMEVAWEACYDLIRDAMLSTEQAK